MEMQEQTQALEVTTVDENGTTTPIVDVKPEDDTQMRIVEEGEVAWDIVFTEEAKENAPEQPTEAVIEPPLPEDQSPAIGFLQSEFEALSAAFPGELPFAHLADMPRLGAFLTLREKGLTAREAYLAIEGARSGPSSVAHLRAAAPRVAVPTAPTLLSRETLEEWRRLFPHLSDKEIGALYRRTAPQV